MSRTRRRAAAARWGAAITAVADGNPGEGAAGGRRQKAVTSSLVVRDCLRQQIHTWEKTVSKRLKSAPAYAQLLSVAGIGPILAQPIVLETGDMRRLPPVGTYAASCCCGKSTKLSHGKRKG